MVQKSSLKKTLKKLFISKNYDDVFLCKNIIITIGTPIDEYLNPKVKPIRKNY